LQDLLAEQLPSPSIDSISAVLKGMSDADVISALGLDGAGEVVTATTSSTNTRHPLFIKAEALDLSTIKFKRASTLSDIQVSVDHREPPALISALKTSKIPDLNIKSLSQECDVKIVSCSSSDELIIERKTVSDLNQSVISNHAHSQSERYFEYMAEKAERGIHVRVLWVIEGEPAAGVLPNYALNGLPQLTGFINYLSMINDQFCVFTYDINHTAYTVVKMIQGYFERTLQQPVSIGKTAQVKRQRKDTLDSSGASRSGLNLRSQLLFIDGMTNPIANELSLLGKSFREIVCMSQDELLLIKNVGTKRAERIHAAFNVL